MYVCYICILYMYVYSQLNSVRVYQFNSSPLDSQKACAASCAAASRPPPHELRIEPNRIELN